MTRWLYLCSDLGIPLDGTKGASEHARAITRALAEAGADMRVLAARGRLPDGHPARQVDFSGGSDARKLSETIRGWLEELDEKPALGGELAQIAYEAMLAAAIREGRFDEPTDVIVERLSLFGGAGRLLSARLGATFIVEMNAPISREARIYRDASLHRLAERIESQTLAAADVIMTVSEELRDEVIQRLGLDAQRVVCVSNGVDIELFSQRHDRAEVRRQADVPEDCVLFGFVGSLKAWHGVGLILRALARIAPDLPRAHLLVVGDRRRTGEYQQLAAELGIATRVTFYGDADHVTVARLMSAMDVGLASYLPQENFYFSPLKLYEYMAAGLCVIASRGGEIARTVSDEADGLLVLPGDVDKLAEQMLQAGRDEVLRDRLGAAARLSVQGRDWGQVAARVMELAQCARRRAPERMEATYVAT